MAEAILFQQSVSKDLQNTAQFIDAVNNDNRFARYLDTTNYYDMYNGTTYTSLYNSKITEIIPYFFAFAIPNTINFPNVTKIGKAAFYKAEIRYISIGQYLLSNQSIYIDDYAFYDAGFNAVTIGSNCAHIGKRAFTNCSRMNYIPSAIYNNVSYIGDHAFENCYPYDQAVFMSSKVYIGYKAFYNANIPTLEIDGTDIELGDYAFGSCYNLVMVNIPNAEYIKGFNSTTFRGCKYKLGTVLLSSIKTIPSLTFGDYDGGFSLSLTTVVAPECEYIEGPNFWNCNINNVETFSACKIIGKSTFINCLNIKQLAMSYCEIIESSAFVSCINMSNTIYLPNCISIGEGAFANGAHPTQFITYKLSRYPSSFTNGAGSIFDDLEILNAYNMPIISCPFFMYKSKLRAVRLSECEYIETPAFINCSSLTSLYLYGSKFTSISHITTFQGCNESLTIYVPSELYNTYINDPVWNQISSRISAIE